MNKKEVAEIKRQFKFENDAMAIISFATFYVKSSKIVSSELKYFADNSEFKGGVAASNCWGEVEEICFLDIIKKTFGGSVGKTLVEYTFPTNVVLDEKSNYCQLVDLIGNFKKENLQKYAEKIVKNVHQEGDYVILFSRSSYTVPTKDANGVKDDLEFSDGTVHDFITMSICPVDKSKPSIIIQKDAVSKQNTDWVITAPVLGFSFPTFNDRQTDVNSVLVFNKKPKEPCLDLIEKVLECKYELNPDDERERFKNFLNKISGSDTVNYDLSKNVHEEISNLINDSSVNTELTKVGKIELKAILEANGFEEEKLEKFDEIYNDEIGEYDLTAVNLVENNKMNIKSPDIVVNVKNNSLDKVSSKVIDGHKCLVIEFDENIEINGLNVNIE